MRRKTLGVGWEERRLLSLLSLLGEDGCPICEHVARSDATCVFWFFNEKYCEWELDESSRTIAWQFRPEAKGTEERARKRALLRFSGWVEEETG